MEKIVPLISSGTVGPLGLAHLPRLWLKTLLHATGRLPPGYRHGAGGIDALLFETIGVDADAFGAFVAAELPTYLRCEAWVREHATDVRPETIRAFTESMRTRVKPIVQLRSQWAYIGTDDERIDGTVLVNDLDDWTTVHAQATTGALPPLIAASLHSELSELLRALIARCGAMRAIVRVDLPAFGMAPTKPLTEARRAGAASLLADETTDADGSPPVAFVKRELRVFRDDGDGAADGLARIVAPVLAGGAVVAWIALHDDAPRSWTYGDATAVEAAAGRAAELIREAS
ncbi:MAG TPA: DUF5069 domain-containing protein [Candidatus Elarobacter sp.]|jgi:hypothetical protein|nr:DUF5069 domain-containing protein [Candidatus Elarobacter sp.]